MQILEGIESLRQDQRAIRDQLEILQSKGHKRGYDQISDPTIDSPPHPVKSPPKQVDKGEPMDEDSDQTTTVPQSAVSGMGPPSDVHTSIAGSMDANLHIVQQVHDNIEAQKRGDIQPDVGGIPAEHTTSVENLRSWPSIKALYDCAGLDNASTITEYEVAQGFLRPYGIGQTGDEVFEDKRSEIAASPASDHSDPIEPEGLWGTNQLEGHLRLDEPTLTRLYENYFRHFHKLQPFLDRPRLKRMLDHFILKYKPTTSPPNSTTSPFAVPAIPADSNSSVSSKRSRTGHLGTPQSEHQGISPDFGADFPAPAKAMEKALPNAIILLVVALGKISEHKRYFRSPARPGEKITISNNHASPQSTASPSNSVRPSPTSSHATVSSAHTPPAADRFDPLGRTSNGEGTRRQIRNIDIFPGLAYYVTATDILDSFVRMENVQGNFVGNQLHQIWAFLLAGLYMGQLCRAMESFGWIQKACKAWIKLQEK